MNSHDCLRPSARPLLGGLILALSVLVSVVPAARSQGNKMTREEMKKLKGATVMLLVKVPGGQTFQGTGFFVLERGLIVTNAHVLGMLDPTSRRPLSVQVVLDSGETDSRTLSAKVIGVDRGSDLGLVQVEGKNLPTPIKIGSTGDLAETDEVIVIGFPLADRVGKNITMTKTTISSLRKVGGHLRQIQVEGGMHPGNSGGPVTDGKGRVVGVAVSGLHNTSIRFAIPAETLKTFLDGRISGFSQDQAYSDAGKVKVPVRVEMIDPLGKVGKVQIECWVGKPGPGRRPAEKEPVAQSGDESVQRFVLKYDEKRGVATGEIALPPLKPGQVHWLRPMYTNGSGVTKWVSCGARSPSGVVERKAINLTFKPVVEARFLADLVSEGSFRMRDEDDDEFSLSLSMKAGVLEENAQEVEDGMLQTLQFPRFAMGIRVNGKPIEASDRLREVAADARLLEGSAEVEKDGSVTKSTADLARVPEGSQAMLKDLSNELLQALEMTSVPLPNKKIEPMYTWKASRTVTIGALDYAVPALADMQYKYLGTMQVAGKKVAVVQVSATLKGTRGTGVNIGGTFIGSALIDAETGLTLSHAGTFRVDMDLNARRQKLKASGTLFVQVKRGPAPAPKK